MKVFSICFPIADCRNDRDRYCFGYRDRHAPRRRRWTEFRDHCRRRREQRPPHAVPTNRPVGRHEPITIDMGLVLTGYCSDMTRSFTLGSPDERFLAIHRVVRAAQQAGIAAIKPGVPMKTVDRAARSVIESAGYGSFSGIRSVTGLVSPSMRRQAFPPEVAANSKPA
jgi:methionine aminopeptidase